MSSVVLWVILISASFVAGFEEPFRILEGNGRTSYRKRGSREIRTGFRDGRLLYQTSSESLDPRKGLFFQNRPSEPLHDMYRKGFGNLHVPDFRRQALEESIPVRGDGNQSIDDIISGIIHLLGGDVLVTRPETKVPSRVFPSSTRPTRINNRGPAHFDSHLRRKSNTTIVSPTNSSVISVGTSGERIVFPGVTAASSILGLSNDTTIRYDEASKNSPGFVDDTRSIASKSVVIIPSEGLGSYYIVSNYSSKTDLTERSIIHGGTIKPTGVLTEFGASGHTIIETVVSAELPDYIRNKNKKDGFSKPAINYTDLPIILPSTTSRVSSSVDVPSGPVTEWLPIPKPDERRNDATYKPKPDEPVIITRPPDSFEITITRQMYNNMSTTDLPVPTFTSLITPSDVTSSTDISVSIVATQVDVIYGRPSITALPLPPQPPPLLHPLPPQPPPPPTGRPQVYPVDIGEVRPEARPSVYQRPRPHDQGLNKYGNSMRPVPRPGGIIRKPPSFRPPAPPLLPEIRIDTCVVGDDSTCDIQLKEQCRTERGVSSCLCRPGYGRIELRTLCTPVVSMLLTVKVAKLADKNIDPSHFVPGSPEYQRLNYEASHAVSTLFGYSPLSEAYRGAMVNRIYFIANRMVINSTVHLAESEVGGSLRHHVEHAVATSINRRDNRLGTSQLFINGPLSALVEVEDLNECGDRILNDCSEFAECDNLFGSFQCKCKPGYTDKSDGDSKNTGKICSACSPDYCNGKGLCVVVQGRQECRCRGNYGGSRCQVDNEVVGVSVGVSVIAIIVIAITAACLYLWNKRWKRAHQKNEAAKHAGYRLQTMADHVRWGATSLGSTYVPSESTMQLSTPALSTTASQLYAISTIQPPRHTHRSHMYEDDINPYGRIIRTLQKRNSLTHGGGGLHYDTLNSECPSSEEIGFSSIPSNSFVYHGTFPERSSMYR